MKYLHILFIAFIFFFISCQKNDSGSYNYADIATQPDENFEFYEEERQDEDVPDENIIVEFEDKNLRECVRKALYKLREEEITAADMKFLIRLECVADYDDEIISSLSGLEYAIELEELVVDENRITNLMPLRKTKKLKYISLKNNDDLKDVEPLDILNLEELYLDNNNLTNIGDLMYRSMLKTLSAPHNNINSVKELVLMANLTDLNLSHNDLEDIAMLDSLFNIKYLYLGHNHIKDISVLKNLGLFFRMRTLDLSENEIENIYAIGYLISLQFLNVSHNKVSDISYLKHNNLMMEVDISYNRVKDISVLLELPELSEVNISHNCIEDDDMINELEKQGINVINEDQSPSNCL